MIDATGTFSSYSGTSPDSGTFPSDSADMDYGGGRDKSQDKDKAGSDTSIH